MKIISFTWTSDALRHGKTVTRRTWTDGYAHRFRAGDLVAAYDRNPRHGGRQVATIRLTKTPYRESTKDAPEEDFQLEGFAYLQEMGVKVDRMTPEALWRLWRRFPRDMWVVRFDLVS